MSYDAACKRLLSSKIVLAWLMKSCMKEYENCEIQEIMNDYLEGEISDQTAVHPDEELYGQRIRGIGGEDASVNEGTIVYDIRLRVPVPAPDMSRTWLIVDIEAQNDFYPGYPIIKRGLYYGSRMISSQYGTEFTASRYGEIKKVYSIWICTHPPKFRRGTINTYSIRERQMIGNAKEPEKNYDLIEVMILCLGSEDGESSSGILRLLEVLLSADRSAEEKIRILRNEFSIKITPDLERKVTEVCNLSKGVAEWGLAMGLEEGMKKGVKKGLEVSIRNLMDSMQWPAGQAMDALKIPETEREQYLKLLKGQKM